MDVSVAAAAISSKAQEALEGISTLSGQLEGIRHFADQLVTNSAIGSQGASLPYLTIFMLACFVGYYVVLNVTQALHSPLMAVTNAVSSVIILGAIAALGATEVSLLALVLSFIAIALASVNIFGGFSITHRMLGLFRRK